MEMVDRYARTYHRWAKQPTNAELDAERHAQRQQIVDTLHAAATAVLDHVKSSHAAELRVIGALSAALTDDDGATVPARVLDSTTVFEFGPVLYPPHPDWVITETSRPDDQP